jgi:hypothetical protein
MGRLLAFVLGGLALALYGPHLFMSAEGLADYMQWWTDKIGIEWYQKIFAHGPGIFAGLALILLAVRGRDAHVPH